MGYSVLASGLFLLSEEGNLGGLVGYTYSKILVMLLYLFALSPYSSVLSGLVK